MRLLGVSAQTVRRMCDYGKFPGATRTDGRYDFEVVLESNRPIGEMLVKFSCCSTEEARTILEQGPMKESLHKYDENDFHVWVTAIKSQANIILTSNTNRFPIQIGSMISIHPKIFLKYLGLEESFELEATE